MVGIVEQTRLGAAALIIVMLAGCAPKDGAPVAAPTHSVGMPNPASRYCVEQGGRIELREGQGGQSGYCHLPDGRVVEEWALFRAANHPERPKG